jgi:hypothetical protein
MGLRKTTGRIAVAGPKFEPLGTALWSLTESNMTSDAHGANRNAC